MAQCVILVLFDNSKEVTLLELKWRFGYLFPNVVVPCIYTTMENPTLIYINSARHFSVENMDQLEDVQGYFNYSDRGHHQLSVGLAAASWSFSW